MCSKVNVILYFAARITVRNVDRTSEMSVLHTLWLRPVMKVEEMTY